MSIINKNVSGEIITRSFCHKSKEKRAFITFKTYCIVLNTQKTIVFTFFWTETLILKRDVQAIEVNKDT